MTAPLPPEVVEGWRMVIAKIIWNVATGVAPNYDDPEPLERAAWVAVFYPSPVNHDLFRQVHEGADAILSALPLERVVEALKPLANECDAVTKWNGDDPPTYSQILPPDNDWAPCFRTKYGDIRRAREALSLALGGRGGEGASVAESTDAPRFAAATEAQHSAGEEK